MTNHNLENPENSELVTLNALLDSNINRWWIEAMLYGKYPTNILEYYGKALTDVILPGDQELLKQTELILEANKRQCLYGANGTGKTLLLLTT